MKIRTRAAPFLAGLFLAVFVAGCASTQEVRTDAKPQGAEEAQTQQELKTAQSAPAEPEEWQKQAAIIVTVLKRIAEEGLYDVDMEACAAHMLKAVTDGLIPAEAEAKKKATEGQEGHQGREGRLKNEFPCMDRHTRYFSPKAAKQFREGTSGKFGGVGIEITDRDGPVMIIAPIEGTPGFRAGLQSGDVIKAVREEGDARATEVKDLNHAVDLLRGKPNTTVTITIVRGDETENITVTRAVINVNSVPEAKLVGDIGYVRLSMFSSKSVGELEEAIKSLNIPGEYPKLIIDLRRNPGGSLLAVKIDLLRHSDNPNDIILTTKEKNGSREHLVGKFNDRVSRHFTSPQIGIFKHYRIAVLVDRFSASASEIYAGTLQDWGRDRGGQFVVVGEKTYGKGSVQTLLPLPFSAMLKLTTAEYLVGNRRSAVNHIGIIPDYIVPDSRVKQKDGRDVFYPEHTATSEDVQYMKALEILRNMSSH